MSFIDTDLRSNAFAIRRLEPDGLEAFDISRLSETNIGRLRRSFDVDDEAAVQATRAWRISRNSKSKKINIPPSNHHRRRRNQHDA